MGLFVMILCVSQENIIALTFSLALWHIQWSCELSLRGASFPCHVLFEDVIKASSVSKDVNPNHWWIRGKLGINLGDKIYDESYRTYALRSILSLSNTRFSFRFTWNMTLKPMTFFDGPTLKTEGTIESSINHGINC